MSQTNIPADARSHFDVSEQNRVRQVRERAHYDRETVYAILDEGLVAHVGFVVDGRPVVIPMTYGRDGDRIFIHGAKKARIMKESSDAMVSIGVTLIDGLVVARSMFESSMNYRAVVIHGRAREVEDRDARLHALRCVSEHTLPGRWDEVRAPTENELNMTGVLEVTIESASAKVRQGPAKDDYETYDEQVWMGVVPVTTALGYPVVDNKVASGVPIPPSLHRSRRG